MSYWDYDEDFAHYTSDEGRTMTAAGGSLHPLKFEIEIPSSLNESGDNNWDLLSNDDFESFDEQAMLASFLPGILFHDDQDHEIRQEPPALATMRQQDPVVEDVDRLMTMSHSRPTVSRSSSARSCTATTPDAVELELEFQRSLRKLANSMRRSDESRSMVKRQRSCNNENDFFASSRCEELERTRQSMLEMIRKDDF